MSERDIALVDELLARGSEHDLLEFKLNNKDHKLIAKLCSAMSNAAGIAKVDFAYVLWGVNDDGEIMGTKFNPDAETVGNTVMSLWLSQRLKPSISFSFRGIDHPQGRIVLLEIPAATIAPVASEDIAYIRIGSSTPKLTAYPEYQQKLINNLRSYHWEKGIAKAFVEEDDILKLLDYPGYFKLTKQNLPDNRKGIFERLSADDLIAKDVGGRWNITNLGAILFANDLDEFASPLARKAVRFIAYEGSNKASRVTHRHDDRKGYASGFEALLNYINGLLPQNEHIGTAFREPQPLYPEITIRELVANALIHQDMTISGTGPQIVLFKDRMEITNPGKSLIQPERMIDLPPRSRNEALASLMRRMNICEEEGGGLDKVVISIELYQLPPLNLQANDDSMQAVIYSPRPFARMSPDERIRACVQHAIIKYLDGGQRMKNASLCARFGIDSKKNAAQATQVLKATLERGFIKLADKERPRAGYIPFWA